MWLYCPQQNPHLLGRSTAMRAILYPRVSSDEQRRGLSLEHQLKELRRFVADNDFRVIAEFEEDYTGLEYIRPAMDQIRDLAMQGAFDALIVTDTDRYARGQLAALMLDDYFKRTKIRLFSLKD